MFSLMSMLVIGRVIGPEATGTGMMAIAAFMLLDVAGATLFTDAVVQHPRLTPRHAGSALIGATLVGCVAAVILVLGAPLLASSADAPAVAALALTLAPLLPISAFAGCASGLVLRQQRFMLLAARVLVGQPLALAVGLGLAATGHGPWAMIGNQVVATITAFLLLVCLGRFVARPAIDRESLKALWPVAGPQVLAVFVMVGRYRLFLLALGLVTTEAVLAVCHFAFRMLDAALVMVWQATSRIAMPRLCGLQGDDHAQAEAFGDLAQLQALLGMPLAAGIALTAPDLVQALLGPAWYQTAHAAQIVGLSAIVTFIHGDTTSLFVARGKPKRNVTVAAAATIIPLTALAVFQPATPSGVALAWASQALIMPPILTWMVLREVNRPASWLLARIAPALVATGALAAVVIALELTLKMSALTELIVAAIAGASVYGAVAWMMLRGRLPRALSGRATVIAAE
ncbi:oligosaccharide flippase family protein [Roseomonas stagni]|uniref:Oligosaccharide flippase family protein n=1 Tax=Falsiroseomonas algicola TaxID=2716930 RepID=A0A6M1LKD6_9PROT|nr:oligosaccharide flippase family protein [Falsiroseomonas algicola]NGM20274.1 oligosaccharide flippase family protein [Falsiroseomonas algicola]